ncbi:MAG: DNA replication and repair protein RecF, partial [Candidatus Dormibacteraeota bacterium]|nr:DNA replication and repair protein RecF [Candidatus Dormibacteraeota bacterium]
LVQIEPGYARALSRYTRVVEQRNHLLRRVQAQEASPDELEVWDLELCRFGSQLVQARAAAGVELAAGAAAAHQSIAPGEELELSYSGPPDDLAQAVAQARADDLRRGVTTVGPHRDDLLITLAGRDTRAYASQGQQRTAVVAIKLAEAQVVGRRAGEPPVLLLDDVLSELDANRRAKLLQHLGEGAQVVVTSVEADPFPEDVIGRSRVLQISRGSVVEED